MFLDNITSYVLPFSITMAVSLVLTLIVRRWALRLSIVDRPETDPDRKLHTRPVPLLGGMAIFFSMAVVVTGYAVFSDRLLGGYLLPKHMIGIGIAGLVLMIGGYLDDRYRLSPWRQIIWPVIATVIVIASGIGVSYITNPLGGVLRLDTIRILVADIGSTPLYIVLLADIFSFLWLMGMMYTTKFLDGLDGLVAGITTIGAIVLFFLSVSQAVGQPETALLSIILAGACAGFLVFNFHPAKIYLGEGGSLFTGFMLGVLSILSGAKIATALLIVGIPALDVAWVIIRRLMRKESPFRTADTKHLHFQMLGIGLSHRGVVLTLYFITLVFGTAAIFLSNSQEKLWAFIVLVLVMIGLATSIVVQYRRRQRLTQ